jgi:hypothetical protein
LKNQSSSQPSTTSTPPLSPTETPPASTETADGKTVLTKAEEAPPSAPEKYEDFKLPEGVKLEGDQLKSAQDLFKDLNLPQDSAQKLIDFHVAQLKASTETSNKAYEDMRSDWQTKTKADPELGPKLPQIKETIGRALSTLNDPKLVSEFSQAMDLTGAGDHPAFVKAFYKLSQAVTEGRHVQGSGPSSFGQLRPGTDAKPSVARAMYPNNP